MTGTTPPPVWMLTIAERDARLTQPAPDGPAGAPNDA